MVLNTLQNLGLWAKSTKKNFFDLPLDVRQMPGFALTNFNILRELGRGENDVKDSLV